MEQKRHLRNYRVLVIGLDGRVDLHFLHLQTLLRLLKVPPLHLMMTSHVSATPTTKPLFSPEDRSALGGHPKRLCHEHVPLYAKP